MKPWQMHQTDMPPPNPVSPDECLEGFALVFREEPRFWKAFGARSPNVFQFEIDGTHNWFIQLDESGARVEQGAHAQPTLTWRSSATAFSAAFSGDHDDRDPVRIEGEIAPLQDLLRAISQS